ncbi:TlpA disulfide reductase family protein [Dyadobacter sp. CY312]|uniref:TlpA disulfide reductase family protein n=1 Tax=Dyadobacter sp. CY312 TaxID=2907303 RepID=UPI001F34E038|nr:TlpA disulfide reductase family protein [Dyadobacter sp. CY312]MCE7044497.1 redoxin family protein [Dyadobacter sp. CY312]
MKLILLCIAVAMSVASYAQMTVSGKISPAHSGAILAFNLPFDCWIHPGNAMEVIADSEGKFSVNLAVEKPQIIFLFFAGKRLHLYAEPGKTLMIETDDSLRTIRFGGGLGKENQFRNLLGLTTNNLGKKNWDEMKSKPGDILADLRMVQQSALLQLQDSKFTDSSAFSRMTLADIQYFAVSKLWDLVWQNEIWSKPDISSATKDQWRQALKDAHEAVRLSNSDAVTSYHYQTLIAYYPRYLQHLGANKEEFSKVAEAVFRKPFAEIIQEVRQKGERYWEHTVLQYAFKNKALDYALASFLINGIDQGDLGFQQEAYEDFLSRFPDSPYMPYVREKMKPYLSSLHQTKPESQGIHFLSDSPEITSLDSIISRYKGRVIFIDMWGTWCGPCRQEFAFNKELKERFKNKAVNFAYIAVEHRPNPEKYWREMVSFYNLTGYHILAGKELEKDLNRIYEKQGNLIFPSYILVDQSGKIITIHAKRPSDRETLYRQIEELL